MKDMEATQVFINRQMDKEDVVYIYIGFPGGTIGKEPALQCRRHETQVPLIPGSGRSPGGGHGNPLQYSCLENPMDRGAWQAIVHGITPSQT